MIGRKLQGLREELRERGLDGYLITGTDPHQSEYVPLRWRTREFISGFTGSAGTVIVTMDKALLWTDSRYWIQAGKELADTEFIPYFDPRPPARCVHPGVYVSAYRKAADRSVLLIVGNLKRNAVECEIGIDGKRLDMTPASAADWQTGETLKLDNGKIRLKVEGQGYRLIRVQNFQVPEINIWG